MFSRLFNLKKMDLSAAEAFWTWFAANEDAIIEAFTAGGQAAMAFIPQIDQYLAPIFPYEPNENIQFQMGCNRGKNEFFFFHLNRKALIRDAQTLKEMMPETLKDRWTFIIEA